MDDRDIQRKLRNVRKILKNAEGLDDIIKARNALDTMVSSMHTREDIDVDTSGIIKDLKTWRKNKIEKMLKEDDMGGGGRTRDYDEDDRVESSRSRQNSGSTSRLVQKKSSDVGIVPTKQLKQLQLQLTTERDPKQREKIMRKIELLKNGV